MACNLLQWKTHISKKKYKKIGYLLFLFIALNDFLYFDIKYIFSNWYFLNSNQAKLFFIRENSLGYSKAKYIIIYEIWILEYD